MRVVVAEDSALFREGVIALLQTHSAIAHVREAASLPEVFELIELDPPDVVLTDIRMPPTHTSTRGSDSPTSCAGPTRRSASFRSIRPRARETTG